MKTAIITLFVAIVSINTLHSQATFPLDTLEKLYSYNYANFETYMLKHGYTLSPRNSDDSIQFYLSDYVRENGRRDHCMMEDKPSKAVTFTTTDKSYYIKSKENLHKKGYIYKSKKYDNSQGTYDYYYSNGNLTALLSTVSLPDEKAATGSVNAYILTVFKK